MKKKRDIKKKKNTNRQQSTRIIFIWKENWRFFYSEYEIIQVNKINNNLIKYTVCNMYNMYQH